MKTAERLMEIDNTIWDANKFRSGNDVERNKDKYFADVEKAIKGIKITQELINELEEENHHSMVEALTFIQNIKR